jgi:hypothetical protein
VIAQSELPIYLWMEVANATMYLTNKSTLRTNGRFSLKQKYKGAL